MTITISDYLSVIKLGGVKMLDNLAMVPVFHPENHDPDYITLAEGLETSLLEVEELEGGAQVNDVLLRNKSDQHALLFEGEELVGAKQNRILNVSIFVKPSQKQQIPVSCVERGRWHHQHTEPDGQRFNVANRMHYAQGRKMENRAVSQNLESRKVFRGDQSSVWSDIDRKLDRIEADSDTDASAAMYEASASDLETFVKKFQPEAKQIGSLFLVDGKVAGLEIFSSEKTHSQVLPRIVRSYGLDAIDTDRSRRRSGNKWVGPNTDEVQDATREFLDNLQQSWTKQFEGLGLGQNVRFKDDNITGGALIHEDKVLHLCAFAD